MSCSGNTDLAQDGAQSFLWGTTQQGATFVPGIASKKQRRDKVEKAISAVDKHVTNPSAAQQQGQGQEVPAGSSVNTTGHHCATHDGMAADLNGVGQQFDGYTHL